MGLGAAEGVGQRGNVQDIICRIELHHCPLLAAFFTAGLAAAVEDPLHQLIHMRGLCTRALQSHHFPLSLGRHAGVTVHQRLGGLWERVGDAVAETLTQTGSVLNRARLTSRVPDYLCDVLGFAPGALVREQRQTVDVCRRCC